MEYGAIDLHTRRSEIRLVKEDGTVVLQRRIDTTRREFERIFGGRRRIRVLIESSTESEWVAQCLEAVGHEVIVADPNYAPMYGQRTRRVKTDRRDVAALAEACRRGWYRAAHRIAAPQRRTRQALRVRTHAVRVRAATVSLIRTLLRQEGLRLPRVGVESVLTALDRLALPAGLAAVVAPLRQLLQQANATLTTLDAAVTAQAHADPVVRQLMTAPGVGPVVALTYRAVLDDPGRFGGEARRASAFLGLVPSEDSSAERRHRGHITKTGPRDLRALLIQASWVIWRSRQPASAGLQAWAHALAARRGRRIAVVALARRLSRVLFAMWRDRRDFTATPRRPAAAAA